MHFQSWVEKGFVWVGNQQVVYILPLLTPHVPCHKSAFSNVCELHAQNQSDHMLFFIEIVSHEVILMFFFRIRFKWVGVFFAKPCTHTHSFRETLTLQ